jgi:hypothetical protein
MSAVFNAVLVGVAVVCMGVTTAAAAAKRQADTWSYYHFDGSRFVAGQPKDGTSVALRTGDRPVMQAYAAPIEAVKLAPGTGAIAGICFIQSSGGKLKQGPPYLPCPRVTVQIFAGDQIVATTVTDEQGYFVVILAPGRYRVSSREDVEVTVKDGTTTLVPLRAGKRMVD